MAISKKGKRTITVGKDVFYWLHKFEEDSLRLIVMTQEKTNSKLICDFSYRNLNIYFRELVKGDDFYKDKGLWITEGVLTPWVVRQVIDYGLENGWSPFEKGKEFSVKDIEQKLDINFWTETTSKTRKSKI
jgi:hypothetical protein